MVTLRYREPEKPERLSIISINPTSLRICNAEIGLSGSKSLRDGKTPQADGLGIVLRDAQPPSIHHRQIVLG
jgi:hypothetical protein